MMRMAIKNRSASIFAEYIIIFGVIAMLFVAMNTYVKRSYQGRIKDMTDYFIGTEQVVTQDSESHTKGETNIEQEAQMVQRGLGGGRRTSDLRDSTKTDIMSVTMMPEESNYTGRFFDADSAQVGVVPPGDQEADEDKLNQQLAQERRDAYEKKINELTTERDQKLALAQIKKDQAASLEAEAVNCLAQAKDISDDLSKPRFPPLSAQERQRMRQQIIDLRARATAARAEAAKLRKDAVPLQNEAAAIQVQIDALQSELNQAR